MNHLVSNSLCISKSELDLLSEGKSIAIFPSVFLSQGQSFGLICVDNDVRNRTSNLWATCEFCTSIDSLEKLERLHAIFPWSVGITANQFQEVGFIFLAGLRVYKSVEKLEGVNEDKGSFLSLQNSILVDTSIPILSDTLFKRQRNHLEKQTLPEHPELEELQGTIAHYAKTHSAAKILNEDLKTFLGWTDTRKIEELNPTWIREITVSGNSSDGDLFEKRVRQGFVHLGFTNNRTDPKVSLNPEASGGSGGLDFYCEFPYPIIGECKASKDLKVNDNKDGAPSQLIKLGHKHLTPKEFSCAIKIIMAPGELTKDSEKTAIGNHMNVIKPETLERLVNLKNAHPGSIDLLKLKPYLEQGPFGLGADERLDEFTSNSLQLVQLRSHVVKTFKEYLEKTKVSESGVEKFSGFFCNSNAPQHLEDQELHEILIELSSPLTGYLGRTKRNTWKDDRFYFLRDLIV